MVYELSGEVAHEGTSRKAVGGGIREAGVAAWTMCRVARAARILSSF